MQALQKLGTAPNLQLTAQLREASKAALDLSNHLHNAFNQETGKLDLVNFNNSLKQSGVTFEQYAKKLISIGPSGEQAFLKVAQSIGKAELPLKRSNKLLNELWTTMKNTARWQLTASTLHGFMGAISTAYGYSKDLNASLNSIRIVTEKNIESMDRFAEKANKAAQALSTTTTNYTDASLIYYQQGLNDEEVEGRTNTTIKLANVAAESAQTASEQLTAIWNNFYDGGKSLEYYADVMTALGASTASSTQEISEGVQKFASVVNTIGLSYEYATSALATITATTRESANTVGTALKTLFSRIQGLKLGDTLDDGTDLNKYSEALQKVGIDIKDTNGQLKDMDIILDEMGAKWKTLAKDQQMALAQTVAGVRQYTQLVALMENWDFFQENLETARSSEGTLERQAQIYAESWEAARNRVRAAAEDIYDSLINDDFFIGLDDAFTPFLSGIATVVDALGGMQGVLALVAMTMNKVYGDKIAQSLRDMATNISIISGNESKRARALQAQAVKIAEELTTTLAANDAQAMKINLLREEIVLQGTINEKYDGLNSSQQNWLSNEQLKLDAIKQQVVAASELAEKLIQSSQDKELEILIGVELKDGWQDKLKKKITELNRAEGLIGTGKGLRINIDEANFDNTIRNMVNQLNSLAAQGNRLSSLSNAFQRLTDEERNSEQTLRELLIRFGETPAADATLEQLQARFREIGEESSLSNTHVRELAQLLKSMGADSATVQSYIAEIRQLDTALRNGTISQEQYNSQVEKLIQKLRDGAIPSITDWANAIVRVGTTLSQVTIALNAFKSLGRVFEDSDMTDGERFITILTSISMILPVVSTLLKLVAEREKIAAAAKVIYTAVTKIATAVINGETAAILANLAARLASNAAMLAVVVIAAVVVAAIYRIVKAYNADADAAKKAREEAEKLKDSYNDIKNSYEELKKSLSQYQEARDGLDELVKGTDEWKTAVAELNQQVLELLDAYPQLAQYISNKDGILEISTDGIDAILDEQNAKVQSAFRTSMLANSRANDAESKSLYTDYGRETGVGSYWAEKVADAISEQGSGILENTETLAEATGMSEYLAESVINNREATLQLSSAVEANTKSNEVLAGQIGSSMLEGTEYEGNTQLEQLVGNKVQELYKDTYAKWEDTGKVGTAPNDETAQKQYAEMMGYQWVSNDSGNKGTYVVNGETQQIADVVARAALAQRDAQEAATADIEKYANALTDLTSSVAGQSENVQNAAANFALGISDISDLTQQEVAALEDTDFSGLSDDTLATLGFGSVDEIIALRDQAVADWESGMSNITDDMAHSVQDAFAKIDISDKTLSESKFIAETFERATAYGKLEEAVAAYQEDSLEGLEEFAAGLGEVRGSIAENYTEIQKVIDDLETGDTISADDYATLGEAGEGYFALMLDGTYKLTENALAFRDSVKQALETETLDRKADLEDQNATLSSMQNYDMDKLSETSRYQDKNDNKWYYDPQTLQQQINLIRELGDQSEAASAEVNKWQEMLNKRDSIATEDLQAIADKAAGCSEAFDGLNDRIASNQEAMNALDLQLAYSYESLGELREALENDKISMAAFNNAALALDKATDTASLDPEEWEEFADYLKDAADEMEGLNDEMSDNDARIVAKSIMKMNDAIDTLADNFEDWSDILKKSSADSEEFARAMNDTRNAVADLLDINKDFVSSEFISGNLDLIKQAATGSAEAIDKLKQKLSEQIVIDIVGVDKLTDLPADIMTQWQWLQDYLANTTFELGPVNDQTFIDGLNALIESTEMTVDQVNALCDSLGFEAAYEQDNVEYTQKVPITSTEHKRNVLETDEHGNPIHWVDEEYPTKTEYVDNTGTYAAFAVDVAADGKPPSPKVSGLVKKATGSYNNYSSKNKGGPSPGKSKKTNGGGDKTKEAKKEDKAESKAEKDRYHVINRQIANQADLLDEIGTRIDRSYGQKALSLFTNKEKELNVQLDNQNKKLAEAEQYLNLDRQALQDFLALGGTAAIFGEDGEILNYDALEAAELAHYEASLAAYNAYLDTYNDMTGEQQEAAEADLKAEKEKLELAEKRWSTWGEVSKQYEDTLDVINEEKQAIIDLKRELADLRLTKIELRMELVLDVKNMEDAVRELSKEMAEIFGDALTHGLQTQILDAEQARANVDLFGEQQTQWELLRKEYDSADNEVDRNRIIQDIKELQGEIVSNAEALIEWVNSLEDRIPEAIDAAHERYSLFINQLEHNSTVLDTIKELYTLQGVTYKTMEGFNKLQRVSQEKLEAQVAQSQLQKKWYDDARIRYEQAKANLDSLNGDESDIRYDTYKKEHDALLEEMNEAEEAYMSLAKEAMETAQEIYMTNLEKAVYDFGQVVSGGIGLDLLQDKYDHYIEKDERYLDKVNEAYQTTSWFNKLQQDIDKATNSATKERLKALQEEINLRREGGKLSQYDLDILNAKYEVLKAQMALEDAQNAKNNMQLVRDRQGNWNYQYTADPNEVAGAEQDLLDAENEWYNIAKQQVTDVTGQIIDTWQECQEKIKEIYSDMTLTDEERANRAAEIYAYYSDKIKYLEEEKQIAIGDMTEAGNASLFTAAVLMGDELTDLTGLTSKDIQDIVAQGGESVIGLLTADNETIKNIIASNTGLIDLFDNTYAQDLDNMTKNSATFETELNKLLDNCEKGYNDLQNTIQKVADDTGTSQDELAAKTEELSDSTDILRESGLNAADALWEMIDKTRELTYEQLDLAESIWATIEAMKALAAEQAAKVKEEVGPADIEDEPPNNKPLDSIYVPPQTPAPTPEPTGNTISHSDMVQLVYDMGRGNYNNNPYRQKIVEGKYPGLYSTAQQILNDALDGENGSRYNYNHNAELWKRENVEAAVSAAGYDTGGYTGEFQDGKLAFLHQKELVLNQDDTSNMLATVQVVRDVFSTIEKILDGNGIAALSLMAQKLSTVPVDSTHDSIEQTIHIDNIEFPNVTSSDEITDAFASIANDAVQWARRRKE